MKINSSTIVIIIALLMSSCTPQDKGAFKNKKLIKYKGYYDNGNLKYDISYNSLKNKKEGTSYTYYENGSLESILNYKNDTLDGLALTFDTLGLVLKNGNYLKGVEYGWWTYIQGNSIIRAYLSNGVTKGKKKYYNIDLKLDIESYILQSKNDNITNEIIYYYDNNEINYSKSRFFTYSLVKQNSDSSLLSLKLFCSQKFDYKKISIGKYNANYYMEDSAYCFNSGLTGDSISITIPSDTTLNALIHLDRDTLINDKICKYGTTIYVDLFSKNHLYDSLD